MNNNDVKLIQQVLAGDESAFAELVKKYQKPVHVLAWRKVGDFHIAEEITQDTFLKVYQRLHTLKEPNQFSGWLYVIATRRCYAWLRKKRIRTQPLEDAETTMEQRDVYSRHVIDERKNSAAEAQREVVKILLAKLKESERTVMTLHYLGEMTVGEISKFLGVSAGTIKSRLQRARHRLQKEETMIREALDHFQISPNLTDNIMQEISRLKPSPSASKPLMPWIAAASSIVFIVLMLGIGSQYLACFQQPYSLDAQTEMTVELVDTPIVLNVDAKSDVQNRLGNPNIVGKSDISGQKPDEVLLAAAQAEGEDVSVLKQQWIQAEPILGSKVDTLYASQEGELYTVKDAHIYKWQDDRTGWKQVSGDIRDYHDRLNETTSINEVPIAKWNNTLYLVLRNLFMASKDDGKTWKTIHTWTDGIRIPNTLVVSEQWFWVRFYNNTYRSMDKGKSWKNVTHESDSLQGIMFLLPVQNEVFAGTNTGFYRWNTENWEQIKLPVPEALIITSAAATKDKLYVMTSLGVDFLDVKAVKDGQQRSWWIFRSTDLGNSWDDITPTNAWNLKGWPPPIHLVAAGETLLAMGHGLVRSTDSGDTWISPQAAHTLPSKLTALRTTVALNEHVFYAQGNGLHRSIDYGKSWKKVRIDQDKRKLGIGNLIAPQGNERIQNMQPTLYGLAGISIVKTKNKGKSWKDIQVEMPMAAPVREEPPWLTQITTSNGVIYAKGRSHYPIGELRHYLVSKDEDKLLPISGIPTIDSRELIDHLRNSQNLSLEALQKKFLGANQFFKTLLQSTPQEQETLIQKGLDGPFAVSDGTVYMEYNFKLFRWEPGDTEWQDIGQEETSNRTWPDLKLAVSGNTVYVGKRDGHLVVSFDRGNNWIDLTPALPFRVILFKRIVTTGSAVYVATHAGTLISKDGRKWQVATGADGGNLIMEELAVDGTTLYGLTQKTGIYRLDNDTCTWEQIITEIPESAEYNIAFNGTSLTVARNTIYLGTQKDGMIHFTIEE